MSATDGDALSSLVTAVRRVSTAGGLDVSADLTVTVDGHELQVEAYTDRVLVEFPSLRAAAALLRSAPDSPGGAGTGARGSLPEALAAADLTAVARVGSRQIATVGAGASGPLRHLGYDHVMMSPRGLALAGLGL